MATYNYASWFPFINWHTINSFNISRRFRFNVTLLNYLNRQFTAISMPAKTIGYSQFSIFIYLVFLSYSWHLKCDNEVPFVITDIDTQVVIYHTSTIYDTLYNILQRNRIAWYMTWLQIHLYNDPKLIYIHAIPYGWAITNPKVNLRAGQGMT